METTLTQMAHAAIEAYRSVPGGVESITYYAKASPTASPITHAVAEAIIRGYRLSALTPETILATDRHCRIPTDAVTWMPTDYDEIVRSDATRWRVQSVQYGLGYPFYHLQLRQIG